MLEIGKGHGLILIVRHWKSYTHYNKAEEVIFDNICFGLFDPLGAALAKIPKMESKELARIPDVDH
jgi:hypothetical protein